ncbi:MAG TPA: hypothetical protein VGY97_08010 [Solirubrobacteraceae bacterium]|jgi:hypothetical protein|nr:hypothetical protein [Solirubrobacteraceae bacterium]
MNTDKWSVPVYTVPADQPRMPVTLDDPGSDPQLADAFEQVPVPAGARPADGTDHQLVIWQPATDTMWEFWIMRQDAGVWKARYGGRMSNVSTNPGYFDDPPRWGATATSIPLLGGLVRVSELNAGHIDHALALAVPEPRQGSYSWPAQRTDGTAPQPQAIPEGARFRLDPNLNIDALGLPPLTRMLALAAQRYGIVVRDRGGCVAFYGEDPNPLGYNPWTAPGGPFDHTMPSAALTKFPWNSLQALQTDMHSST